MVLQRVSVSLGGVCGAPACQCELRLSLQMGLWGHSLGAVHSWQVLTHLHTVEVWHLLSPLPLPLPLPCLSHTIRWLPLSHSQQ